MTLSEKIKKLRQQKGWSQAQLANKLQMHVQHISRYERGISAPSAEALTKLAELFGVSTDYLLDDNLKNSSSLEIKDQKLLKYFRKVDKLEEDDKKLIIGVIESVLIKNKVKNMVLSDDED